MKSPLNSSIIAPALCLAILAGLAAEASTRVQPTDAEPFHARARAAIDSIPTEMDSGNWISQDVPEPPSATALLRPNAILSRHYLKRLPDGRTLTAGVLIVQCKDARDMQGHYPPRCYPANGATLVEQLPRTWTIGGMKISGMEYLFTQLTQGRNEDLRVYNFFVIPRIPGLADDGLYGIYPDIEAVYKSGEDYQRRYYGAAQFQFVFPNELSQSVRDQIMTELLENNVGVIRTLTND